MSDEADGENRKQLQSTNGLLSQETQQIFRDGEPNYPYPPRIMPSCFKLITQSLAQSGYEFHLVLMNFYSLALLISTAVDFTFEIMLVLF